MGYLRAVHDQLGGRLAFQVWLVLTDFDLRSYAPFLRRAGASEADVATLGLFASVGPREHDGTPKPALALWDSFRRAPWAGQAGSGSVPEPLPTMP